MTSIAPPCLTINGRDMDYCAVFADYEPGDPLGYGSTAVDAVADLKEKCDAL